MILKNIKGMITFKATGNNTLNFVNNMKNENIPSFNIKISGGEVFADVYRKDFKTIKNIANKNKMNLFLCNEKGIIFKFIKYKTRYGILIGFLASLVLSVYMSNIVLTIEIQGNYNISEEKIVDCLNESGIIYGKFIPNISFKEAERKILTSFENISWNSIRHFGGRIVIEVDETESPIKIVPNNIPCNIVSDRDAQIVNAEVYSGKLIRQIGDGVKRGDLIVSGMETDIHGKSSFFHSLAKITGVYKEKVIFEEQLKNENISETGKSEHKHWLKLFELELPLFFVENHYKLSDIDEEINYLELFGHKTPIGMINRTYYECISHVTEQSKEDAIIKLTQSINTYEQEILKGRKIVDKEVLDIYNDKYIKKIILYTIEGEIGANKIIVESDNDYTY